MSDRDPVVLTKAGARRIKRVCDRVDGEPRNRPQARARWPIGGNSSLKLYVITQTDDDDNPVAIWRCNDVWHVPGIEAKLPVIDGCSITSDEDEEPTIIWGQCLTNVVVTGDLVLVRGVKTTIEGETRARRQIISTGANFWGAAETQEAISSTGDVQLYEDGPVVEARVFEGTLASGTTVGVFFDDHAQEFVIVPAMCPS